jgi:hypothetical protein
LSKNFPDSLTTQGFTGLINTPNAQVLEEGESSFLYSNSKDNHFRNYDDSVSMKSQDNFIVGVGFLSSLELSGKLVENLDIGAGIRDLSGNLKYKVYDEETFLPSVAIGWQDFGSASNYYSNRYIVIDKQIDFLRLSMGYGESLNEKGSPRMNGFFGGLEAQVTEGVSFIGEYDGEEHHVALRLKSPKSWLSHNIKIGGTLAQNLSVSETSFLLNVNIPLFRDNQENKSVDFYQEKEHLESSLQEIKKKPIKEYGKEETSIQSIESKLVSVGFENIQVGLYNKSLYIKVENSIFDENDLDALGVILGIILENHQDEKHYIITLLKNNIQTLTMSGKIKYCKEYFYNPTLQSKLAFKKSLHFSRAFNENNVKFLTEKRNSSRFIPRFELSPSLTTTVGTEVGLFDYLIGLRTNVYVNILDGLTFSTIYETPLLYSQNFDDGYVFSKTYKERLDGRFVNTMLHQTIHKDLLLNTLSFGQYQSDYLGLLNHFNFTTVSGEHGFNLQLGRFKNQSKNRHDTRDIYMASYRYFYVPLDFYTEFSYGRYWNQDSGGMVQMKRFFGETSIAFYLKDTVKRYAGFEVSIPLTPRKLDKASSYGQLKGKADFTYGIRTVINSSDGANNLTPSGGIFPRNGLDLTTVYLNRDRLSSGYIKSHINRMRESFLLYSKNK